MLEAYEEGLVRSMVVTCFMRLKNLMKLKFYFHNLNGPKSALMAAIPYVQDYYGDSVAELKIY